jgi:adenylate kinase family enzyme
MPNRFLENRINNIEEKTEKVHELIKNDGKYLVVEDIEKEEII